MKQETLKKANMIKVIDIVILFLVSVVILSIFPGCSQAPVAGTGSQAGNGNVTATVLYPDGSPVIGTDVFIRQKDYLEDTSDIAYERIPDAVTNSSGVFIIDSVNPGNYFIEINDNKENARLVECNIESSNIWPMDLGNIEILQAASFAGKIDLDNIQNTVAVYVQLYGVEYLNKVATGGKFSFNGLPSGTFKLRIFSSDSSLGIVDSETIVIGPGEDHDAGKFLLPFDFWRDTVVVRTILDLNDKYQLPVSDVITIKNGRITKLNLTHRGLHILPAVIVDLRLTHLLVGENFLDSLPSEIGKVSSLVHLGLMRNRLTRLPETICNLNRLKHLNLNENRINLLPKEIGKLSSLVHLSIRKNNLQKLPITIDDLSGLKVLDVSSNTLAILPVSITNLKELVFLSVNFNRLKSVPPEIKTWLDTYSTDKEWKATQKGPPF